MRSDTARKGREHEEESKNLLVVLAPSLLGVAVFYCVPFLYAAYYAVIDNIGSGQFVGLQNFIDVLQNELFRTAAKNTLIFMALTGAARHGFGAFDGALLAEDQPRAAAFIAVPIITACGAERHGRVFLEDLIRPKRAFDPHAGAVRRAA